MNPKWDSRWLWDLDSLINWLPRVLISPKPEKGLSLCWVKLTKWTDLTWFSTFAFHRALYSQNVQAKRFSLPSEPLASLWSKSEFSNCIYFLLNDEICITYEKWAKNFSLKCYFYLSIRCMLFVYLSQRIPLN